MLSGIRVLDFGRVLVAPYLTQMLIDLGAEVFKIERPGTGADERLLPPFKDAQSGYFMMLNRGKKSVAIDLGHKKAPLLIADFARHVDILVENFRPGVARRLGCNYETLSAINPRLIMVSLSLYGQEGPFAKRPGYDIIAQAASGLMWLTGYEGREPQRNGTSIGDVNCAAHSGMALCAALFYREITGRGQHIDMSLRDCLTSVLESSAVRHTVSDGADSPGRLGNIHPVRTPYGLFPGPDGRHLVIGVDTAGQWEGFCRALKRDEWLEDPILKTPAGRLERKGEIYAALREWLRAQPSTEAAIAAFRREGVPSAPVRHTADLVDNDTTFRNRGNLVEVKDPLIGLTTLPATPFGALRPAEGRAVTTAPPLVGEHTVEVLSQVLGYDESKIRSLLEEKVVFQAERKT